MIDRAGILTAPGAAALAVIRISGRGVHAWCDKHLSRPLTPSRGVHVELRDEAGDVIDDPVAFLEPHAGFADLSLHGGSWVVESTISLLRRGGFEIVPGTAFADGDDALERELVRWLPRATTESAARCLLAQAQAWRDVSGDWGRFWRDPRYRAIRLSRVAVGERRRISEDQALRRLLNPPTVAIVGAPNVGKSSLANRLLAHDRAIVADLPGTTRDWVGETADLEGLPVTLVDTPGVRQTDDPIERAAIERSGGVVAAADLVVVVLDASSATDPAAEVLLARFPEALVVSNKMDRPAAVARDGAIRTSAVTGAGVERVAEAIERRFGVYRIDVSLPRLWTEEQFAAFTAAA